MTSKRDTSKTLSQAVNYIDKTSLPKPDTWENEEIEDLKFPKDLTKLHTDELGALMSSWSSVMAYAEYEVAKADVEQRARENKWDNAKTIQYLKLREDDSLTEKERKAILSSDQRLARLKRDFEFAKAKHSLLDSLLKGYTRYWKSLSREISRRENYPMERNVDKARRRSEKLDSIEDEIAEGEDQAKEMLTGE